MKYVFTLICFLPCFLCIAQDVLNGDFENHPFEECTYNLSDDEFNASVPSIFAFGKAFVTEGNVGEVDLQTFECYVDPPSGDWCVGLSADTSAFSDAISLELSSNLEIGEKYEITFSLHSVTNNVNPVEIGLSQNEDDFGYSLGVYTPAFDNWTIQKISFTAEENSNYITIKAVPGEFSWVQIDAVSIKPFETSLIENELEVSEIYPNPCTDFLNIKFAKQNKILHLIVSDLLGRKCFSAKYSNVNRVSCDLSNLKPATYIIELDDGRSKQNLRIIKL